jgi:hypothetical protein
MLLLLEASIEINIVVWIGLDSRAAFGVAPLRPRPAQTPSTT